MLDSIRSLGNTTLWILSALFLALAVWFLASAIMHLRRDHLRNSLKGELAPVDLEPVEDTAAPAPVETVDTRDPALIPLGEVPFEALSPKEQQALRWWTFGVRGKGEPIPRLSPESALFSLKPTTGFFSAAFVLSSTEPNLTFLGECPHVWPGLRVWVRSNKPSGIPRGQQDYDSKRSNLLFSLTPPGEKKGVKFELTATVTLFGVTWLDLDLDDQALVSCKVHRFCRDAADVWNELGSAERRAILNVAVYVYHLVALPRHEATLEKTAAREAAKQKMLRRLENF